MIIKEVVIEWIMGFHARPSALLTQIANEFDSNIVIESRREKVNGKSIMGMLMLGVQGGGDKIKIYIEGKDEKEAMQAIISYIERENEQQKRPIFD